MQIFCCTCTFKIILGERRVGTLELVALPHTILLYSSSRRSSRYLCRPRTCFELITYHIGWFRAWVISSFGECSSYFWVEISWILDYAIVVLSGTCRYVTSVPSVKLRWPIELGVMLLSLWRLPRTTSECYCPWIRGSSHHPYWDNLS